MKTMKKLTALVVALVMALAMATTAFAATVTNETNHSYAAYQIFAGTQNAEGNLAVSGWGTGVNGETLLDALIKIDAYADCETAADVAAVVATFANDSASAEAFAKIVNANLTTVSTAIAADATTVDLNTGYYLIVDTTNVAGQNDAKNLSLLAVTDSITIANKTDIPSVEKKVQDINDSTETTLTNLIDSADYDIGDHVPFTLTGTLPSNYADYTTYKYVFHDTLSAGLTYDGNAKVYAINGNAKTEITSAFSTTDLTEIKCNDLKAIEGVTINANTKIVVEYTATLNDDAAIGYVGNPNEVYLEFSNNPNYTGDGDKSPTGETPKDKVVVFTYQLDVNKVNEHNDPLTGAGFTLYKFDAKTQAWVAVSDEIAGEDITEFVFKGIDDGKYKLVETTVPDGYNKADDVEFDVTAAHEEDSANPALTNLAVNKQTITVEMTEDGKYYTGELVTTIVNNSGATLPTTGGMGTTVIYVIGAILVLGAGVLLITRRRVAR